MRHRDAVEEVSQFPSRVLVDARGASIENAEQCALRQPCFLRDVGCDLVADPRKPEMKDILNKRVKHRQAFRPFAPIVLAERAREVFEGEEESPFMLIARNVRPELRDRIPAIVHVDGTARVQTVREETNPVLYRLLKEFEALTGIPVLINTSFNIKGEPIVE